MDWTVPYTALGDLLGHHWPISALAARSGKTVIRFWRPVPEARGGDEASDVASGMGEDNATSIGVRWQP